MPKVDGLTHKQKTFIKEYVKTRNGTKSALKAYDTKDPATANAIAVENLQKPSIKTEIAKILKTKDIGVEEILEPVVQGLKASKTDDADHSTRLRSSKMLQDLTGMTDQENKPSLHFHKHLHEQGSKYDL